MKFIQTKRHQTHLKSSQIARDTEYDAVARPARAFYLKNNKSEEHAAYMRPVVRAVEEEVSGARNDSCLSSAQICFAI